MKNLRLFTCFLAVLFLSTMLHGADYCTPTMKNAMVGYIESVKTTGATQDINFKDLDATTNTGALHYTEVANKVVNSAMKVIAGQEITLSANAQFARWGAIHVFFDFDANGVFESSEKITTFGNPSNGTNETDLEAINTHTFTIPADIAGGQTRMRVVIAGGGYADGKNGCDDLDNQEGAYYDFEVTVEEIVEYCTPTFSGTGYVGTITSASSTGATTNLIYELVNNYPNEIVGNEIIAQPGQTIQMTINVKNLYWGYLQLYADLNGDGNFDDSTEKVGEWAKGFGNAGNHEYDPDGGASIALKEMPGITIPSDFSKSEFRIRAIIGGSDVSGACGAYRDGGYYDFVVKVQEQINTFTLTYDANPVGGTLSFNKDGETLNSGAEVPEGSILTFTTTPEEGYELVSVKVNGSDFIGNRITMVEDITVEAVFQEIVIGGSALSIPASSGYAKCYRFQFDDNLLGVHKNGTNNTDPSKIDKGDYRTRSITMSAWIKTSSLTGDLFGYTQKPFYGAEGAFAVNVQGGKLALRHREWKGGGDAPGMGNALSTTHGLGNQWAFVSLVIDDVNKKLYLYKDGEFVLEKTMLESQYGIGYLSDESVFFFGNGGMGVDVDEVQIWDRTLTADQVLASMGGYETAPEGLIYYYKFGPDNLAPNGTFANKGYARVLPGATEGTEPTNVSPSGLYSAARSGSWSSNAPIVTEPEFVGGRTPEFCTVTYTQPAAGGTIVVKAGNTTVASGEQLNKGALLTIEVTPEEGYQVKTISVNGEELEGNTFNLMTDAEITVELTGDLALAYSVIGEEGGSIKVEVDGKEVENNGEFKKGKDAVISITVNEGYELTSLLINGEEKKEALAEGKLSLESVQSNLTIQATFSILQFEVTIPRYDNGTITVKNGNTPIASGDKVDFGSILTIQLAANSVSQLIEFTINGADKMGDLENNKMEVVVSEALVLSALFKSIEYTLVYDNKTPNYGTVTAINDSKGGAEVASGDKVVKNNYLCLVITPKDDECDIETLKVNGVTIQLENNMDFETYDGYYEYWFEMSEDMTMEVTFSSSGLSLDNESVNRQVYYDNATETLVLPGNVQAVVYDITGTSVLETNAASVDMGGYKAGCYLVAVVGNKTFKFIKR